MISFLSNESFFLRLLINNVCPKCEDAGLLYLPQCSHLISMNIIQVFIYLIFQSASAIVFAPFQRINFLPYSLIKILCLI